MKSIINIIATIVIVQAIFGFVEPKCSKRFMKEFMEEHNRLRRKFGAPPLKYSSEINKFAQQWSDKLANSKSFRHRPHNKYGENLFQSWASDPSGLKDDGKKSVDSWYSEKSKYHWYGREPNMSQFSQFGHFTQLVWRGSKKLGVGCTMKGKKIVVVANYYPRGNMRGQFKKNVKK